ncbi:MAG: hypothetical protein ABI778_03705 [Ignavibacteriota bacterium]
MKSLIIAFSITTCALMSSCTTTRVSSLVDPLYRDSSYGRILVIGNYSRIGPLKMSEEKMVKNLQDSGVFAIANSDLLPPLRKYSDSEIAVVYRKYDLDACIVMYSTGDSSEGIYLPGWTNISNGVNYGGFGGTTMTTSVTASGGSFQKTKYVETRAELRDIRTGYLVSRCETSSQQTSYPGSLILEENNEYLMTSICQKMVAEFRKNRLVRKK